MFGWFRSLLPREERFFDLFARHSSTVLKGAHSLKDVLEGGEETFVHCQRVNQFENDADGITREVLTAVRRTFITPFDRDEIHKLISTMDDILDLMEDVATAVWMYDVKSVPAEARTLGEICVKCCERVQSTVALLSDMDRASEILKLCEEIDGLESEADRLLRASLSKLFREESDVKELIKQKAVSELLESVTDKCEDVANIIEGIVLENA